MFIVLDDLTGAVVSDPVWGTVFIDNYGSWTHNVYRNGDYFTLQTKLSLDGW